MANPLATPTFVSGASDKLAAVDVYKTQQQTGQVVNSVKNLLQAYDPKLARSLAGFNSLDIQSIARSALGMTGLSGAGSQLLNRVMQTNPGIGNTIRSMDSAVREQFTGLMGSVGGKATEMFGQAKGAVSDLMGGAKDLASSAVGSIGDGFGQLGSGTFGMDNSDNFNCSIGGVTSPIKLDNIFQTQQMGGLVNSITGMDSMVFKDNGAQVSLYTSTIKQCFDCEVSGVTKDIFATIADRQVLSIVAREVMPDVVKYSSVNDLFSLGSNLYEGELLAATPSLLNIFTRTFANNQKSQYYSGSYNSGAAKHIATYAELLQAYNAAYPGWNSYVRKTDLGDEIVLDISPLVGGTPTFNNIITAGATNSGNAAEKPYLMAPMIKADGVEQLLQKQYPRTKFYFSAQVSKVADPRSLNRL